MAPALFTLLASATAAATTASTLPAALPAAQPLTQADVFIAFGVSLALGLLVGMQREYAASEFAGIRTFALIALLGTLSALLAEAFGPWILAASALGLAAMLIAGNFLRVQRPAAPGTAAPGTLVTPGMTTEVAGLVMFAVGAFVLSGRLIVPGHHLSVAMAVAGTVALLLYYKTPMHNLVQRMGERDLRAIMQFVLIALVILPILPDYAFDPYHVINPREVWTVVVLIVGISLAGYIIYKILGATAGTLLGGILGGVISSTATTVSYARRSAAAPGTLNLAGTVIMTAAAVSLLRVIGEIAVVAPTAFGRLVLPLGALAGAWVVLAAVVYLWSRKHDHEMPEHGNPAELRAAIAFGLLYGLIKFAVAAARDHLGRSGLYGIAALSGLADMDAITLSSARLAESHDLTAHTAWHLIATAALSNTLFKLTTIAFLGSRALLRRMLVIFGLAMLAGLLLLVLWPS